MKILYSFNKKGFEAEYWTREILSASNDEIEFVPFNHGSYLEPNRYLRAQLLDNLYFRREPGLLALYAAIEARLRETKADVLFVDNCPPYHPEFLRTLDVYKALRICDGPTTAYDRDFAYLHAYDHIFYHSRAYSSDLTMPEKLAYCGAARTSFWPLAVFDAFCDPDLSEDAVFRIPKIHDIVFVGAIYPEKMEFLANISREYGSRFQIFGLTNWKKNLYFNTRYGARKWVRPLDFSSYKSVYQRAKIGINAHLRGKYTVGNYRMFDLPANGVLQVTDGGEYVEDFFAPGTEIETYDTGEEAMAKIEHLLSNPSQREEIARGGFRRAMRDHRIAKRLRDLRPVLAASL